MKIRNGMPEFYDDVPHLTSVDSRDLCRGQNCTCMSACALIWFGGIERGGMVGLHRPYIVGPVFKGLSPADASTTYRRLLDGVAAYLNEMEVPTSIVELMVATGSDDIRWVQAFDDQLDLDRPPSIAEWSDASCPAVPSDLSKLTEHEKHKLFYCTPILFAK